MKKLRYLLLLFALLIPQTGFGWVGYSHNPACITQPQTDETTPLTVTESSSYSSSYLGWKAFNQSYNRSGGWVTGNHLCEIGQYVTIDVVTPVSMLMAVK